MNNKTRKDTQIKFCKAMAVPTLKYIRIRNLDYNKRKRYVKIETAEMKLLRSVAGYTRKDQISTEINIVTCTL
jgi:hypothetical protein